MKLSTESSFPDPSHSELAQRLLEARLHDPRLILGRHRIDANRTRYRANLPHAVSAAFGPSRSPMRRIGETSLFEWIGSHSEAASPAHILWTDARGTATQVIDPYGFQPTLDATTLAPFNQGREYRAYRFLGAHVRTIAGTTGTVFAVWAPNAERVSVVGDFNRWDGRCHPMAVQGGTGVWELFIPGLAGGQIYKYEIRNRDTGKLYLKSDPYGRHFEFRPANASVVTPDPEPTWHDAAWLERRRDTDWLRAPISVYELHLGSWRKGPHGEFLNYVDIAHQLCPYIKRLGFTHVELLPVTEHPFDDSWGYQSTGFFAPTSRFGSPADFGQFVATCHAHGIGVILDWVPGHFPKDDHGLAQFDGTTLYEYADPRKREHPDWQTLVFDYGRNEVRSFLISSAIFWLEELHVDALRVDAVASMLYLDYSRKAGEWTPNMFGSNENLEAVDFLRSLNEVTHGEAPGSLTFAEESTAWPKVSRPTYNGGLGFSFKWNMGWMHDTLLYAGKDPVHRSFHHDLLTFGPIYAFTENFVLPLSHDEVVHGKGSLLGRMPGDDWQRFANLRLLYLFQWTYPGKKLLFMGGEFAQPGEWNHHAQLPWHLLNDRRHGSMSTLIADLNHLYRSQSALRRDADGEGFYWLSWQDRANSVLSFARRDGDDHILIALNFTPVPRYDYRLGVPFAGQYRELLNSDSRFYGGSDVGNPLPLRSAAIEWMGQPHSIAVTLPPLGGIVLAPDQLTG